MSIVFLLSTNLYSGLPIRFAPVRDNRMNLVQSVQAIERPRRTVQVVTRVNIMADTLVQVPQHSSL